MPPVILNGSYNHLSPFQLKTVKILFVPLEILKGPLIQLELLPVTVLPAQGPGEKCSCLCLSRP